MPVTIDPEREVEVPRSKRNYENGVPLILTEEQKRAVIMTKYISLNPQHADWQPEGEWFEQVVADIPRGTRRKGRPRLSVETDGGGSRPLTADDGCIIDLVGTMTRVVGIVEGRPPMSEQDVDDYQEVNDEPVPMFQQWDFRVTRVLKTDGPQGRINLARSEEQKRLDAQADMFAAIADAFREGFQGLAQKGEMAPSPEAVIAEAKRKVKTGENIITTGAEKATA